jgi:tetratricopeptide (TPR) repeat protein
MKKAFILFVIVFSVLGFSNWSFSQNQEVPIDSNEERTARSYFSLPSRFRSLWETRKELLTKEDFSQLEELDIEILNLARESGIKVFPELAGAYFLEATEFAAKGKYDQASLDLKKSIFLDPCFPSSYYLLGKISFKSSKFIPALRWYLGGIKAAKKSLLNRYLTLINMLYIFILSALFFTVIFALLKLIKYHKQIRHDFEEFWTGKLPPALGSALAIFYIFAPLLLFLGVGIFIVYLIVISWRYYRGAEKLFAWAGLVLIAIFSILTGGTLVLVEFSRSPKLEVATNFIEERLDGRMGDNLIIIREREPNDLTANILLALEYQREEEFDLAFEEYGKLIQEHPELSLPYNNRGNILFIYGRPELAIENYKQALELDPVNPIPYYNLSLAYSELLQFDQANKMMAEARRLNPTLAAPYSKAEARMIDIKPSREELLSWSLNDFSILLRKKAYLSSGSTSGSLFLISSTIIGLAGLLAVLIISISLRDLPAALVCEMCGKAFCYRCRVGIPKSSYCSQCYHLFVKKDGVSPQAKEMKLSQIRGHKLSKKLLRFITTILLPGSGHQLGNQTCLGGVLLLFWLLLFFSFIFYRSFLSPVPLSSASLAPVRVIFGAGAVIIYLVSIFSLKVED